MTASATNIDTARLEAARLAYALLRFQCAVAWPMHANQGEPVMGRDFYAFTPSWQKVPASEVEAFLVALPSPALLSPTTDRGMIALILVDELSGDRRRWAEKTLSNFTAGFDEMCGQLGLGPTSRFLLEFDRESHVFGYAGVREWTGRLGVQVGWNLRPLTDDPRAEAQICVRRSDGNWSPPMMTPGFQRRVTPCRACGTLAEEPTKSCPRCGADRTRT